MDDYPEHEKLKGISELSQSCDEFLEWLRDEKGMSLCELVEIENGGMTVAAGIISIAKGEEPRIFTEEAWEPTIRPIMEFLAEFFGVNQDRLEMEKRAILDEFRANQLGG